MIRVEIVDSSIIPFESDDNQKEKGAELIFNGRVRGNGAWEEDKNARI